MVKKLTKRKMTNRKGGFFLSLRRHSRTFFFIELWMPVKKTILSISQTLLCTLEEHFLSLKSQNDLPVSLSFPCPDKKMTLFSLFRNECCHLMLVDCVTHGNARFHWQLGSPKVYSGTCKIQLAFPNLHFSNKSPNVFWSFFHDLHDS